MKRYQDLGFDLYWHVVGLTKSREFQGHQAARTVMIHFAMGLANKEDPRRGFQKGHVMPGLVSIPSIVDCTGLNRATVSRAIRWLADHGFIRVTYLIEGNRRRIADVEITSYNGESEQFRQEYLAKLDSEHGDQN